MSNCNKNIHTMYIGNFPVDTLDSVPDYMLAERDVLGPNTNETVRSLVRVPGAKLFGGGTMDNVTTIEPNTTFTVEDGQPIAAYASNEGSYNVVKRADANHAPQFFIIGTLGDLLLIQNAGFITYNEGHSYIVGQTYYLNTEDGTPTTSSASGVKLFVPISTTKLAIMLGR